MAAASEGLGARDLLETRLKATDAVVQNQDNREHDLLDSDDYYQFEGGLAASVETLRGEAPRIFHNDHSRPERPVIRALDEEIARVVRGRAANPKWIAGVMRHGYKGAFEIAATVDYLFAFAATTNAVQHAPFRAALRRLSRRRGRARLHRGEQPAGAEGDRRALSRGGRPRPLGAAQEQRLWGIASDRGGLVGIGQSAKACPRDAHRESAWARALRFAHPTSGSTGVGSSYQISTS